MAMKEFRCTRPNLYDRDTQGHNDTATRQGYYIQAQTAVIARRIMERRFPGENIDVDLWRG